MPDRIDLLPEPVQSATTGSTLRKFRAMSGMSQTSIASRLGVSPATVRRWEQDKQPMPIDQVVRYASALGLTLALFDRREYGALYGHKDQIRQNRLRAVEMQDTPGQLEVVPGLNFTGR